MLGCDWRAAAAFSSLSHIQTNDERVGVIGCSLGFITETLTFSQNTNVFFCCCSLRTTMHGRTNIGLMVVWVKQRWWGQSQAPAVDMSKSPWAKRSYWLFIYSIVEEDFLFLYFLLSEMWISEKKNLVWFNTHSRTCIQIKLTANTYWGIQQGGKELRERRRRREGFQEENERSQNENPSKWWCGRNAWSPGGAWEARNTGTEEEEKGTGVIFHSLAVVLAVSAGSRSKGLWDYGHCWCSCKSAWSLLTLLISSV